MALPQFFSDVLCYVIGFFVSLCNRSKHRVIKENLGYILDERKKIRRYIILTFIKNIICLKDFFRLFWLRKEKLFAEIETHGLNNLQDALKKGKGAVLVTYHIGNFELAGACLTAMGFPLSVIIEPVVGKEHLHIFNKLRQKFGMKLIDMREPAKILKALMSKRVLVLLGDRDFTGKGMIVKFLKGERKVPIGPAYIALRMNVPLFIGYYLLGGKKRYKVVIEPEIKIKRTQNFKENVKTLTAEITRRMNAVLKEHPDQWFVYQPEWIRP